MALPDKIDSFHRDILLMTGLGSAVALLGMSSYMMAYEFKDFNRVTIDGHDRMEAVYFKRKRMSLVIMVIAAFFYVAGIVLITLGITLYPNEREEIAGNIPGQISQIRSANSQPSINEPAILAGISAAMIVGGAAYGAYVFNKTENFGWIASSVYSAGWIGMSFAASMNNKSIQSLVANRLAWNLPAALLILGGTFLTPWQLQNNYISGPCWPICAIGYLCTVVGSSYLTSAPLT